MENEQLAEDEATPTATRCAEDFQETLILIGNEYTRLQYTIVWEVKSVVGEQARLFTLRDEIG